MSTGEHIEPGCASSASAVDWLDLPSLAIRVSQSQLRVLIADLKVFVCGSHTVNIRAEAAIRPAWMSPGSEEGKFHEALIVLWQQLNATMLPPEYGRYRLRLDLFDATAGVTALRLGMRRRRTDPPSEIPNIGLAARCRSQLVRRMENLRRCLCRAHSKEAGKQAARNFSLSFADYRDAIVAELFHRVPKWAHLSGTRIYYQTIVDHVVTLAVEGLHDIDYDDPDMKDVRHLARQFLAYTRRGRTGLALMDLPEGSIPFENTPHHVHPQSLAEERSREDQE